MGSIWSKWDILGENVPNSLLLGGKNDVVVKILGKWSKIVFTKKFKKFFHGGFIWMNLTKKVIKGIEMAKLCIFCVFPIFLS